MANESSELTFVRCSQCRNLIPAVSTKCRRCGANLESSAAPQAKPAVAEPKVVAHPAVAAKAQEVRPAAVSAPKSAAPAAVLKTNGNGKSHAAELEDPLAAFLDQLEEANYAEESQSQELPSPVVPQEAIFADEPDAPEEDYSFDDFDDELKALFADEEEPAKVAPTTVRPSKPAEKVAAPVVHEEAQSFEDEPLDEPSVPEPIPAPVAPQRKFVAPVRQKVVETKTVKPEPVKPEPAPVVKTKPVTVAKPTVEEEFEEDLEPVKKKVPLAERPEVAARVKEIKQDQGDGDLERQVSGQLVGWLVSFNSAKGQAFELRTGKFFVSKSSIRKSDFVINHSSVSSPHAMFNITSVSSVQVQDLMSELGLFVKRRGSANYKREEDVASLRHGDWLKFGEAEYLVSLLPESE